MKKVLLMLLPMAMSIVSCEKDDVMKDDVMKDDYQENLKLNGHEYVDLGLSVKWATCNVGANAPEEYGDYFAWGDPAGYNSGKTHFSWSEYKWSNGSYDTQTKYCLFEDFGTVDQKTILDSQDDAATVNWGSLWRMPTTEEHHELFHKCTWTWITRNGVNGYNVVGPNGNSIFLPAAGYHNMDGIQGAGSGGDYWSSSLSTSGSNNAYGLGFGLNVLSRFDDYRCFGFSVRPVCQ